MSERDAFFDTQRREIAAHYLAEPGNAFRGSGRSSGAARWEETRRCIADALHRSGDFLDVGCANGLRLESLLGWARERGFALRAHGVDFVPELVALAKQRVPQGEFTVANAFYWKPPSAYDFVRTNLEYVPRADWVEFTRRQFAWVATGGRLILCHYRNAGEKAADVAGVLREAGLAALGRASAPGVEIAWSQRESARGITPAGTVESRARRAAPTPRRRASRSSRRETGPRCA